MSDNQRKSDRFGLTRREREVACLVAQGMSYSEMAAALNVSTNTIATHVKEILAKLDVPSSRRAAVILRDLADEEHPNR